MEPVIGFPVGGAGPLASRLRTDIDQRVWARTRARRVQQGSGASPGAIVVAGELEGGPGARDGLEREGFALSAGPAEILLLGLRGFAAALRVEGLETARAVGLRRIAGSHQSRIVVVKLRLNRWRTGVGLIDANSRR